MKILIVDDSVFSQKTTCNLMKSLLEDAEFFVANDGEEGLEKYKALKPDYLLVDLLMPKLDGKELIHSVKELDSTAKIVVLSADVQKNVRDELEKSDILAFVNKPLNEDKAKMICALIKGEGL